MVPMRRRPVLLALLFTACVTTAPAVAHANTCSTVKTWGTQIPDREYHPCVSPTGVTTFCHGNGGGVDPEANVDVEVCVPLPV
jgi:hypothetical protein